MTEEVKKEENKEVKDEAKKVSISPFVDSEDRVTCTVGYYLRPEGRGFMIQGVHDDYKEELAKDHFDVKFRIPSQKDYNLISSRDTDGDAKSELGIFSAFSKLEYIRMLVLIDTWTLPKPCTEESIEQLHPSFVKGIIAALREKIGMDGIV